MPKQTQSFEQRQSLTMTTTMHQSIMVLQMSNMELAEFAGKALDQNPFIEDGNISEESNIDQAKNNQHISSSYQNSYTSSGVGNNSNYNFLENIAHATTLQEHITEQINLSIYDQKHKIIALYLLDSLQSNGYLNISLEEVAKALKCDLEVVEEVLKKLQTFDPPGIFACSLKECLTLQIMDLNPTDDSLLKMVQNIDLIANRDFKKLSKLCNVNVENIGELIRQLRALNPKPASGFVFEQTSYKMPDVILSFGENNLAKLEINSESMPKLKVNHEYYLKIKDNINSTNDKEFTKNEIESATALVKSIDQRASTILKVATAIVSEQMEFFTNGIMYLKPMNLNHIAAVTGFNESTVSRSTSNKYISTPTGIYELKYFFSSSLANTRSVGADTSSTKVKEIIKQIIMSEESDNILSDDDLTLELAKFNIRIARRTITKYRESIGIPTSAIRKRKALMIN